MPDYQKMYFALFNAVTDTMDILQKAQQAAEEIFVSAPEPLIKIISSSSGEKK